MVSAYAENDGTSETLRKMPSREDIGRSAAQKLRELFARASDWQEIREFKVGMQTADLLVKFTMAKAATRWSWKPLRLASRVRSEGQLLA